MIGAGGLKMRSNDTDFRFRPHSAFAHLTGLGTDREPDAVLVLEPTDSGHDATLYFKPRAPRDAAEFYADTRFGELWVGRRPSLEEMAALCGIACAAIDELRRPPAQGRRHHPAPGAAGRPRRRRSTEVVAEIRPPRGRRERAALTRRRAGRGAERAAAGQGRVRDRRSWARPAGGPPRRSPRWWPSCPRRSAAAGASAGSRASSACTPGTSGNAVGYDTIAASGDHACTLHWIRNDGDLRDGDLMLLDAGVELDSLYTADVTRTLPVNGRFSDAQRMVYDAVFEAQQAGIAAARPGREVLRRAPGGGRGDRPRTSSSGACCRSAPRSRWPTTAASTAAGWCTAPPTTSASTCTTARRPGGRSTGRARCGPGWCITVEPGLYFKPDDELVPERLRGIGVRIEDDIVITETGNVNLSEGLPADQRRGGGVDGRGVGRRRDAGPP